MKTISNLIEELKYTRRGRISLRKYFKRFRSCRSLQAQESPSEKSLEISKLMLELVFLYNDSVPIKPYLFRKYLTSELIDRLTDSDEDNRLIIRASCTEAANVLLSLDPQCKVDFFQLTNRTVCGSKPWFDGVKDFTASLAGCVPNNLKQYLARLDKSLGTWPSTLIGVIKAVTPGLVSAFTSGSNLFFFVSNLQLMFGSAEVWVKAIGLSSLLSFFGVIPPERMGVVALITSLIHFTTKRSTNGYIYLYPQEESYETDPEVVAQWTSLLIGGISATCGFKSEKTWDKGIANFASTLSRTTNAWHTLLTKSCKFVLDYVIYVFGLNNPGELAHKELQFLGIDAKQWLTDVLDVCDPSLHDRVLESKETRSKVSRLYEQGKTVMKTLGVKGGVHPKAGAVLSIWRKLCDLYEETGEVPDSIKANQTPICIWLYGAPGVGKSEAAKTLAVKLAQLLGISYPGDPFFVRQNRKYWDGYHGQPILIFDDALQNKDPNAMSVFLEDWYGVMTPAPFSPEFSKISEKQKYVVPEIVIVTSNEEFPVIQGISNVAAFQRRRDFVIDVQFSESLVKNGIIGPEDLRLAPEILSNFHHLEFRQFASNTDRVGNEIVKPKLGQAMILTELIGHMIPKIEHLRKIRTQSAKNQAKLTDALDPLLIAEARENLLASISKGDSFSSVTAELVKLVAQGGRELKPIAFEFITKPLIPIPACEYDCDNLKRIDYLDNLPDETILSICGFCRKIAVTSTTYAGVTSFLKKPTGVLCMEVSEELKTLNPSVNSYVDKANRRLIRDPFSESFMLAQCGTVSRKEDISELLEVFDNKDESFWGNMALPYKVGIFVVAGFLSLLGVVSCFNKFKDFLSGEPSGTKGLISPIAQMASSGRVPKPSLARGKNYTVLGAQESIDDIIPKVTRNFVKLSVWYMNGKKAFSWACGIGERYIVSPYHIFAHSEGSIDKVDLTLRGNSCDGGSVSLSMDDIKLQRIHNTDLCLVELLSKRIPCFRKIVQKLVPKNRIGSISSEAVIVDVTGMTEATNPALHHVKVSPVDRMATYRSDSLDYSHALLGYTYPVERRGMCGSLLIDKRSGFIIGMHVAGSCGTGYSMLLTNEYFANLDFELTSVDEGLKAGKTVIPKGEFVPIGLVPQSQEASLPLTSGITKAISFGVLAPPAREPVSMFTPGEAVPGFDKLTKALEKGGSPTLSWPLADVKAVQEFLKNEIISTCSPQTTEVGVRSLEEALVGVQSVPFMEPLKRNTSVGWPLATLGFGTTKERFIGYDETCDGLKVNSVRKELVKVYDVCHSQRKQGIIPFSVYHNFLKDERLKPGKNPRLINGCPLEQVIDARRYILDFASATQSNGFNLGIAIGINVHGPDWSRLTNKLLSMGDRVCCGDYSGFGPGLDPDLVLRCGDIVNDWYRAYSNPTKEDELVRRTLFENLAFSYEISKDTVYQTLCGSPSGNAFTALINSLVNLMYVMLSWKQIMRGTVLEDLRYFREYVAIFVYGDDLIMSVSPFVLNRFNNQSLQDCLSERRIAYTDADKSGVIREHCGLEDATFLKCHFVPHPTRGAGFYLAALEKNMIEDIPNWIRKSSPDFEEASLANSISACELAYAWGFDYFRTIVDQLQRFWTSRGRTMAVCTWDYYDRLYFGELMGIALPQYLDPLQYGWA